MLPALPLTDIFQHKSDAAGIDILVDRLSRKTFPRGMGVYCFYSIDETPFYVGVGCGRNPTNSSREWGLLYRMNLYRSGNKAHDLRMHLAIREHKLLMKCWTTSSVADALKYEMDAIVKHGPRLNVVGGEMINKESPEQRRRERSSFVYTPDMMRNCNSCHQDKCCRDFRLCRGKPLGTHPTCRVCEAVQRNHKNNPYIGSVLA